MEGTKSLAFGSVDYPKEGERIRSSHYAFRLAAPVEARKVEIAIDGKTWQDCRFGVGYWWYDWSDFAAGEHQVSGRIHLDEGHIVHLPPRRFSVEIEAKALPAVDGPGARPAPQRADLRKRLKDAGFHVVESDVFHLEFPNRPGELQRLTKQLAEENVDIRYLYGTSHGPTARVVLAVGS